MSSGAPDFDKDKPYGNTVWSPLGSELTAMKALSDNAKESVPTEFLSKVEFFLSWKYTP